MKKKILVILPDGVGLKNFGFSAFPELLSKQNIEAVYWNSTPFNLNQLNLKSIPLSNKVPAKTDILKRVKIDLELNHFSDKFNNEVYQSYKFPSKPNTFKVYVKNKLYEFYKFYYRNNLKAIQLAMNRSVRNSEPYRIALTNLEKEKPDLIFCTNQRASNAIAPVLAAKSLGIPTACFIFSWDNLPKATKIIETDYYFVWSKFMKEELMNYYPIINKNQIKITGTPQFEPHFDTTDDELNIFKKKYNIKSNIDYILFSGDDMTTSPKDEDYLNSICEAVVKINTTRDKKVNVLFRRCPVDFSSRYDVVIYKFSSILTELKPYWKKQGEAWNTILPTKEDAVLLANTIAVSDLVINLGSSMVFDAASHNKPCAYINFNPKGIDLSQWSVKKIYEFIHFQSMPNTDAVIWLNSKEEIADKILEGLNHPKPFVENAREWFSVVNHQPPQEASRRIAEEINQILR